MTEELTNSLSIAYIICTFSPAHLLHWQSQLDTPMRTSRNIRRRKMRPDTAYTTMEVKEMDTSARPGPDMSSGAVSAGCWCGHCLSVSGDVSGSDGDGWEVEDQGYHPPPSVPAVGASQSHSTGSGTAHPLSISSSHHPPLTNWTIGPSNQSNQCLSCMVFLWLWIDMRVASWCWTQYFISINSVSSSLFVEHAYVCIHNILPSYCPYLVSPGVWAWSEVTDDVTDGVPWEPRSGFGHNPQILTSKTD